MYRALSCLGVLVGLILAAGPVSAQSTGPDVIVGSLPSMANYSTAGDYDAFAVGTTSCNIGDSTLIWVASTNQHPVIGQNLYRLNNDRFEQIGVGWLKHGFTALQGSLCAGDEPDWPATCTANPNGSALGVGCSDPYGAGLNGSQGGLGPRYQVNATTGFFPYPYDGGTTSDSTSKRIRVHVDDLNPTLNTGAQYFVEGHYIAPDDAEEGNGLNNASWREVTISGTSDYSAATIGTTQREDPAIYAWQDVNADVEIVTVDVVNDGRFTIGYLVTDNGDGTWTYEYAIHNLNSERSGASLSIPVPITCAVSDEGFHDVEYHSGEPYNGNDWLITQDNFGIKWEVDGDYDIAWDTDRESDVNNALRWGTLYNFRFTCDAAPVTGDLTLGLYKPGEAGDPGEVIFSAMRPEGDLVDALTLNTAEHVGDGNQLGWLTGGVVYDEIEIERDGVVIATLIDGEFGYLDDAVLAPGDYGYTVLAYTAGEIAAGNAAVITVPDLPAAGFNFLAEDASVLTDVDLNGSFDVDVSLTEDGGNAGFPNTVNGFSMGVEHDMALLTVTGVVAGSAISGMNGGDGPDFFAPLLWDNGFSVGCLFDFELSDSLQADVEQTLATASYDIVTDALLGESGAITVLNFSDNLGTPVTTNQVNVGVEIEDPQEFSGVLSIGDTIGDPPVEFRRGDINGDGVVFALIDAIALLDWAFNAGTPPACDDAADVNDDGTIFALVDVLALLDWGFGGAAEPPAPGPLSCGPDGTPGDALDCATTSANCL